MATEKNVIKRIKQPMPEFFKKNAALMGTIATICGIVATSLTPGSVAFVVVTVIGALAGGSLGTSLVTVEQPQVIVQKEIDKLQKKYQDKVTDLLSKHSDGPVLDELKRALDNELRAKIEKLKSKYLK